MRVYFLSEFPCTLWVGGLLLGGIDGHERSVEIDPANALFCECKRPACLPVSFTFDEAFLTAPPDHVRIYHTRTGVAVYVCGFLREDAALRPLAQERIRGTLLTLYVQGRVQLSLSNETGLHIVCLGDEFEGAKLREAGELFLIEAQTAFCLVTRDGEIKVTSEGTVSECGERVTAEVPFRDSLAHTALCTWEKGELTDCRIRTARTPQPATYALALFESVLIGADPAPYLAENLVPKADALKEFLGEFVSVVLTDRGDEIGLVYPRGKRVFEVRYFRVALGEDGKISNISPME